MKNLLKKLTEAVGVSGDEKEIRTLIRDLIHEHVDEWRVDAMGNLIAIKKGSGESDLRVMVDAHMDEVGLMITSIETNGSFRFESVGGVDEKTLPGSVIQIGPQKVIGVIGTTPIHLLSGSEKDKLVKTSSLRIDIGIDNKEKAGRKVKIGYRGTFVTPYEERGSMATGKAFDNRAGCAALISLLSRDRFPFDLIAVFSVQEEVGLRGARVASYSVNPDAALVLECTPAYDLPNRRDTSPNVVLGKGPAIYVMDSGTLQDPRLVSQITRTAAANNIPFQIRRPGGGGTNTATIQSARAGIPAATIATPCRYVHSPVSMISLDDFENVVNLTEAAIRALTPELIKRN